ncbi:hypothetical protein L204_105288 [Cryptococcus depauperatus]
MSKETASDVQESEPRRGRRARKQVDKLDTSQQTSKEAQKQGEGNLEDSEEEDDGASSEEESDHEPAPKGKNTAHKAAIKRPRAIDTTTKKTPAKKRARKSATIVNMEGKGGKEDEIGSKTDSPLFNAFSQPDIALQPLIDDFVFNYQSISSEEQEQESIHELITLFIRSSGISYEISPAEAVDDDGIPDVVERMQDESVLVASAIYPLLVKGKIGKTWRENLRHFIESFVDSLALTPILFETVDNTSHSSLIVPLILNWLMCMSSSPLRPIRHTATHITLLINVSLCRVASNISKDLSIKQRQRDAELRKQDGNSTAAGKKRLKELEERVKESTGRKARLEEFMQEIFDVLFIHRLRDLSPLIRSDCLTSLGSLCTLHSEFYLTPSYFNYFSRGCNDPDSKCRQETVKALKKAYAVEGAVDRVRNTTLRIAPRMVEMACQDIDAHVRVAALHVITEIDKTGILADEDEPLRDRLATLIYSASSQIRKAVGPFIVGLWDERKEDLLTVWGSLKVNKKKKAGKITEEEAANWLGWKSLAALLVHTSYSLINDENETGQEVSPSKGLLYHVESDVPTRAHAAVESISAERAIQHDWQSLVNYLLLDHSTHTQDMWLLTEEEETLMLQTLVSLVQKASSDDEEDENENEERTKILIKTLPRLMAKHQGDDKLADILGLVPFMKLGMYLDMRMTSAYESLWDDVTKQFLQHTSAAVLNTSIKAINALTANTSLSASNTTKLAFLTESLFSSLRSSLGDEDITLASLEDDQVAEVELSLKRLGLLMRSMDLSEVLEEGEGGESSVWDICLAIAERGRLGFREEAGLVEQAVQAIFLHVTWLFKRFTPEDAQLEIKVETLKSRRDAALSAFQMLILGDAINTVDVVKRQAFVAFLNSYILFKPRHKTASGNVPAAEIASLKMEEEIQHRLSGVFQSSLDRYSASFEARLSSQDNIDNTLSIPTDAELQEDFAFFQFVSTFVGAIRIGVLEVEHTKEPLAYYGRLGQTYDAIVKRLVDVLRDEGIYNKEGETVQHVALIALQRSFDIFLDTESDDPQASFSLSKLLATAFTIHGSQFTVLRQLGPSDVSDFHLESLDYLSRRLGGVVKQESNAKNKDQKARIQKKRWAILTFFKLLVPLLGPVQPHDALRIKTHVDEIFLASSIQITSNKGWDQYRAYEKRLVAIASKDPKIRAGMKRAREASPES